MTTVHLPQLLAETFGISTSEARRCMVQGGVRIDGQPVKTCDWHRESLEGKEIRLGKLRSFIFRSEPQRMRFRLLECKTCGRRTWQTDGDLPLLGHTHGEHRHEWWERYTFFAVDEGPGLHPTQVGAEVPS